MQSQNLDDYLILGYYQFRGKMQICRLLCQYLHLKYIDFLFNPQTWQQFKNTQNIKWLYRQLPFCKDRDIVVTQTYPICLYILYKAGRKDLLGITIQDETKVDMFVWESELMCQVYSTLIVCKNESIQKRLDAFNKRWESSLKQKFVALQLFVTDTFYLPYMTIVDFFIYDIIYYFKHEFPQYLSNFPKLIKIYERISKIPQIVVYQNSSKAIKQRCPVEYFKQWKGTWCKNYQGHC